MQSLRSQQHHRCHASRTHIQRLPRPGFHLKNPSAGKKMRCRGGRLVRPASEASVCSRSVRPPAMLPRYNRFTCIEFQFPVIREFWRITMAHELPPLPYAYDALEPTIDKQTMTLHHDMHHGAYVKNLNAAIEKHTQLAGKSAEDLIRDLNAIPEDISGAVRNNGGGHVNHS